MLLLIIPCIALCSYVTGGNSFPEILTPEEEEKYLTAYANGDMNAKNKLIEHNLRLVAHIVKKYAGTNMDAASDLISVGTIGLIKGVNTYKTGHKTKLATYVAKCIENEILILGLKEKQRHIRLKTYIHRCFYVYILQAVWHIFHKFFYQPILPVAYRLKLA